MAILERVRDDVGCVRLGNVVDAHVPHARLRQAVCHNAHGVFGVAVHGGVGQHHAALFRLVPAPLVVLRAEEVRVLPPDGPVQRAEHPDVEARDLLHGRLHLRAVLAHDVGVVAARFIHVQVLKVHLVREQIARQRPEGSEGVRGEEDALFLLVGEHHLRPVHHRCQEEPELMPAQIQHVALLDLQRPTVDGKVIELADHLEGLRVPDDLHVGESSAQLLDVGAVVRLHVVDHQEVDGPAAQHMLDVFEELPGDGGIHRVHQRHLFVQDKVGVVGHAVWQWEHVFKQCEP